jgi:hypothetical protein
VFKTIPQEVWAFDLEWVPDVASGRRAYRLGPGVSDADVLQEMWRRGGADADNPRPYLKTVLCRIVSIAAVVRKRPEHGPVTLTLHSLPLPGSEACTEADIIGRFMGAVGKAKPQLVGFNSHSADLPILLQRALAHRLTLPEFCARPDKPWEGVDYFAKGSDHHVDLKEMFCGWGRATPSLHELATACRIPGKLDTAGRDVIDLWCEGDVRRIVQYNECDALTTFLIWLRAALLGGHLTIEQHDAEVALLQAQLEARAGEPGHPHLREYLDEWRRLRAL